jgi:tripartite-type tricarboxylate transporter receptor subunit TctC
VPGFELSTSYALYGPAALPSLLTDKINRDAGRALESPEVARQLALDGAEAAPANTPAAFKLLLAQEAANSEQVLRQSGISR